MATGASLSVTRAGSFSSGVTAGAASVAGVSATIAVSGADDSATGAVSRACLACSAAS